MTCPVPTRAVSAKLSRTVIKTAPEGAVFSFTSSHAVWYSHEFIRLHIIAIPAVITAEEAGDQFDAQFGRFAPLVLQGVIFDDIDADDIALLADVFGQRGDFAVGEAFGVRHAGAGGVDLVDAVEVEADPYGRD